MPKPTERAAAATDHSSTRHFATHGHFTMVVRDEVTSGDLISDRLISIDDTSTEGLMRHEINHIKSYGADIAFDTLYDGDGTNTAYRTDRLKFTLGLQLWS